MRAPRIHGWRIVALTLRLLFIWALVALFFAFRDYHLLELARLQEPWQELLTGPAIYFLPWAGITPLFMYSVARFQPRGDQRLRNALIVTSIFVGLTVLRVAIDLAVAAWNEHRYDGSWLAHQFMARLNGAVVIGIALLGIFLTVDLYHQTRDREREAFSLETRLARAQLQALRAQLQPHFLFNTLNTVAALIDQDPRAAEKMIADLSELLRRSIDAGEEQQVPLARELDFLDRYLSIQRVRYGEKLRVTQDVDPDLLSMEVPGMILQPLVENAIVHSVAMRREGGSILIRARASGDMAVLQVRDDGDGIREGSREGIGLTNTRARLEKLFGNRQQLRFVHEHGAFTVEMRFPITKEMLLNVQSAHRG
jgi:two-component sensor histidine kinase